MEFTLTTTEGQYDITAHVSHVGRDLLVAVWGGERPHIGAVSVAQPRPSLRDPAVTSATASTICLVGHKEDDLAKGIALALASACKTCVVVTAGIHWDDLPEEGIRAVVQNSRKIVRLILDRIAELEPDFLN